MAMVVSIFAFCSLYVCCSTSSHFPQLNFFYTSEKKTMNPIAEEDRERISMDALQNNMKQVDVARWVLPRFCLPHTVYPAELTLATVVCATQHNANKCKWLIIVCLCLWPHSMVVMCTDPFWCFFYIIKMIYWLCMILWLIQVVFVHHRRHHHRHFRMHWSARLYQLRGLVFVSGIEHWHQIQLWFHVIHALFTHILSVHGFTKEWVIFHFVLDSHICTRLHLLG